MNEHAPRPADPLRRRLKARLPMPSFSEEGPGDQALTAAMLKALHAVRAAASPEGLTPAELERQRRGQQLLGRLAAPLLGLRWEPFDLAGMPAAWVRPERPARDGRAILYCHGGGFTSGSLEYSRPLAARMAARTGWPVLCFAYRLAPEHPCPAAREDARKAWDYLMAQGYGGQDLAVMGDSAGGNLALGLTLQLRDARCRLPRRLVLFSPWTDMTCSGASYGRCADRDPSLTAAYLQATRQAYAPGMDWADPLLSPLFADFTGFPPVLLQAGANEILFDDSARLYERLLAQGVLCRMERWVDMWHVFQMFPLKQADRALDQAAEFLAQP